MGGFIIDVDKDKHVIGMELLDASKKLNVKKLLLNFIKKGEFQAKVEKNIISISFSFVSIIRNKPEQIVTSNMERLNTFNLQESGLKLEVMPVR